MYGTATIWTRAEPCEPCASAKHALAACGIGFHEIVVDEVNVTRQHHFYVRFGNGATFPQIVLDGMDIGGWPQLRRMLERSGAL